MYQHDREWTNMMHFAWEKRTLKWVDQTGGISVEDVLISEYWRRYNARLSGRLADPYDGPDDDDEQPDPYERYGDAEYEHYLHWCERQPLYGGY